MSRGTTSRLRKLEVRSGQEGSFEGRLERMSDDELFQCSRDTSEALVASYGGVEPAIAALEEEGYRGGGGFLRKALTCTTMAEFMGWTDGRQQSAV